VFSAKKTSKNVVVFLFREHKVVVFDKFGTKSGGFMLLTPIEEIRGKIWSK
jgi:hypothetical protein